MKKCALCGKRFAPRRAAAQYCSVECRQRAYRQRQREAEPRYRLERALLTAIRELRGGRPAAALMTIRLAVDDFELARTRSPKKEGARKTRSAKSSAATKGGARRKAGPPGPPPKRSRRPRRAAKPPGPPPTRSRQPRRAPSDSELPPTKRSPKSAAARSRAAAKTTTKGGPRKRPAGGAQKPYSDLHARYEHVLSSGTVTQAEIARRVGLADGSPLSRWRRGGPLAAARVSALDEVVAEYEWEIFAGETLS